MATTDESAEEKPNSNLNLPEKVREIILRYLYPKERRENVLICPAFYGTICYLERNKKLNWMTRQVKGYSR